MGVIFKTVDNIPLSFIRVVNGSAEVGLTVTVKVINIATGAVILAPTTLTEVSPGIYSYVWVHSIQVYTECVAVYTVSGWNYFENFSIDESLSTNESLEGKAT